MSIKIITVGKRNPSWVQDGVKVYEKRLKKPFHTEWVYLPNSPKEGCQAIQNESEAILSRLNGDDFVILLDENGKNIDSIELTGLIENQFQASRQIVFIIGGAYGVGETVQNRADFVWSLSKLVYPHQLVRLILTEQIYRAQEISSGKPYHHS